MSPFRLIIAALILPAVTLAAAGCGSEKPTEESYQIEPPYAKMQDAWPHWCPADANLIAYTHFAMTWEEYLEFGDRTVRILDLRTRKSEHVMSGQVYGWSPDGGSLIVCCDSAGYFIIDLEIGTKKRLPIRGCDPDFSPCGKLIAFWSDDPWGTSIYNLETGQTRWLCSGCEPDWSPDGSRLLCSNLQVYDASGVSLGAIPHSDESGPAVHSRWSPDGTKVIYGSYCSSKKKSVGIWVIDADGTNQRLVTCPGAVPSPSPDGERIAYGARSTDGRAMVLWVVNTDGTNPTQVTFPENP